MGKYVENLYKILFENDFEGVLENTSFKKAVLNVFWTSMFLFYAKYSSGKLLYGDTDVLVAFYNYIMIIFFYWLCSGFFFGYIAQIFCKESKIKELLKLTSYAMLPYIFIAPLEIMKNFSDTGYFFATKFEFLLFFWVIFLYASALAKTYGLKKSSAFSLIFFPIITLFFCVMWLIGTIFNLGYIYTV